MLISVAVLSVLNPLRIFLKRVEKLGQMGDVVRVKDGFARNYLLPKKKALRAPNRTAPISRRNVPSWKRAISSANPRQRRLRASFEGKRFVLLRQAGDRGQLYGSVSPAISPMWLAPAVLR